MFLDTAYDDLGVAPDTMVSEQFNQRPEWTPEQTLCGALIADALHVLRTTAGLHTYDAQVAQAEERAWFASTVNEPTSFEYCAEHCALDAQAIRIRALAPSYNAQEVRA